MTAPSIDPAVVTNIVTEAARDLLTVVKNLLSATVELHTHVHLREMDLLMKNAVGLL